MVGILMPNEEMLVGYTPLPCSPSFVDVHQENSLVLLHTRYH